MSDTPLIAAFRPPDERAEAAASVIEAAGCQPLIDPMIEPEPTGAKPLPGADVTIFTSSTVTDLPAMTDWAPQDTTVAAIGPKTAMALEDAGIAVDIIPETYTSEGLLEALASTVNGATVEVARSDHGTEALLAGLKAHGAEVNETVLYRLTRPDDAGTSVTATLDGEVDALAFTSSLTVEHFLQIAQDQDRFEELRLALADVIVGAIGPPTADTAEAAGVEVDVVAAEATFELLINELTAELEAPTRSA